MRTFIPGTLALLLATACQGFSDVPGIRTDGTVPDAGQSDGDGLGDGLSDEDGSDAGTDQPEEDAGRNSDDGAHLRFATNDKLGNHLVDTEGRALYLRITDTPGSGQSACGDSACAAKWPPYLVPAGTKADDLVPGASIASTELGLITRVDGTLQLTYRGRPLYYYAQDVEVGDLKGDSLDRFEQRVTDGSALYFVARNYSLFLYQQSGVKPAGASQYNIPFLVDGLGRSLYVYNTDTPASDGAAPVSKCTSAECVMKWPVFSGDPSSFVLPSSIDPELFSTFMSETGETQVTFRGWPLYAFSSDAVAGDVKGHSVNDWTLIDPASFATAGAPPPTGP